MKIYRIYLLQINLKEKVEMHKKDAEQENKGIRGGEIYRTTKQFGRWLIDFCGSCFLKEIWAIPRNQSRKKLHVPGH